MTDRFCSCCSCSDHRVAPRGEGVGLARQVEGVPEDVGLQGQEGGVSPNRHRELVNLVNRRRR